MTCTRILLPVLFLSILGCAGERIASVPLAKPDVAGETAAALPAGTRIGFAVHSDSIEGSGAGGLRLHVEFLRDGTVVGRFRCLGYRIHGSSTASGAFELRSGCYTNVPVGGMTGFRVHTELQDVTATFAGLQVELRRLD